MCIDNGGCAGHSACKNTPGSYSCIRTHLVVTVVSVTLDTALMGHDASPRRSIFTYFLSQSTLDAIYESLRESFFSDLALPR